MTHWLDKVVVLLVASTADLRELAELAGADPRTFYRGIDKDELEIEGQNLEGMEFGDGTAQPPTGLSPAEREVLFDLIRRASPKEERVGRLIQALLQFPSDSDEILKLYPSSTAFEERVVSSLLTRLRSSQPMSEEQFQRRVSRACVGLFKHLLNNSRGKFLFALAKHAGTVPAMRSVIESKLSNSYSYEILEYEDEIKRVLTESA